MSQYSDLSQRLEHLVMYSSQLIFVSGSGLAQDRDFAQAFLAEQQADTSVAFLNATRRVDPQQYRFKLAQQIMGFDAEFNDQSLVHALSGADKNTSIIIAISQADQLPNQILQELWDLVLQNRFAKSPQNINIILFGDQQWAESTKAWLPTNNNDKPVLLTTESLTGEEAFEVPGSLEQLINDKRKQFDQRLKERAIAAGAHQSLLANWWVRLGIAMVFLLSFSGILLWQYFDLTQEAVADFQQFLTQSKDEKPAAETTESDAAQSTNVELGDLSAEEQALIAGVSQSEQASTPEPIDPEQREAALAAQLEAAALDSEVTQAADSGQQRVTDWKDALADMDAQSSALLKQQTQNSQTQPHDTELYESESHAEIVVQTDTVDPVPEEIPLTASEADPSSSRGASQPQSQAATVTNEQVSATNAAAAAADAPQLESRTGDYAVADITSVEQLQQQASSPALNSQYTFDEAALLGTSEQRFVLQLAGMSSLSVLNEYLRDNRLSDLVWVYQTFRYGGDWFVVLHNQDFATLAQARDAANQLPSIAQAAVPFAKPMTQVHQEIRATNP